MFSLERKSCLLQHRRQRTTDQGEKCAQSNMQNEKNHHFSSTTIFTGQVWKTSKNDFRNRECPNIGRLRENLQGCKDVCMVKQGCTGFNYNHKTRSCVMRGCSLPVKPPARNYHDGYNAFWLASTTTGSCK